MTSDEYWYIKKGTTIHTHTNKHANWDVKPEKNYSQTNAPNKHVMNRVAKKKGKAMHIRTHKNSHWDVAPGKVKHK
jgi:hypothetical protein